jgi:hypothetical protein
MSTGFSGSECDGDPENEQKDTEDAKVGGEELGEETGWEMYPLWVWSVG